MAEYAIRYTREAVDDLDMIFDYITDDNRRAALTMLEKIEGTIQGLAENPRLGAVLSTDSYSLAPSGYRRMLVAPYMVFYRIGKEEVYVARVLHTRQDWMHLLWNSEYGAN